MSKKRLGWETRLNAYIEENRTKSFKYGELDCALFVFGALRTIAGIRLEKLCCWNSRREAAVFISQYGRNLLQASEKIAKQIGLQEEKNVDLLSRGDVVIYRDLLSNEYTLAIHAGQYIVAPGVNGLVFNNLNLIISGWRV